MMRADDTDARDTADSHVIAERVGYSFLGSERAALADVSFTLTPGSLTVLAGETGSGKSTLMRALAGLIPGASAGRMEGRVRLFDLDTVRASSLDLATRAGLVLQSPDDQICTTDPVSEVAFGLENLCLPEAEIEERVNHWLGRFELKMLREQANNTLSGGQKQRLMLASILAMGPRLLLLDEPLAQLDAAGVAELLDELDRLRATGLMVVVAEHRLDELLRRADRLLILSGGRIISDGSARAVEATAALAQAGLTSPTPQPVFIDRGAASSSGEPVARVDHLTFRWPVNTNALWSDVRFDIHPGECVALVGPNGSGKTTLLSALAGLVRPNEGRVEWSEAPRGSTPVGLTPQNPDLALFCRTVGDELAFGPRQLRLPESDIAQRVARAAEALSIGDLIEQAPLGLSQGQRLRVAVAAALTLHPRLLLLDEPSTGQDPRHVGRLLTAVRGYVAAGDVGAVLFSTHDPSLVESHATRVLAVAEGKLLADCAPAVLFADEELVSQAGLRATTRRLQSRSTPDARLARPPR